MHRLPLAAPIWLTATPETPARQEALYALINLLLGGLGVLILVGGGVGLYLLWYLRGRDRHVGLVAEYLREPPSDIHAGVVGTLLDEHANSHDVVATLTDLGRRGILRIAPDGARKGDYTIELLRRDAILSPVERLLIDTLFTKGASRARLGAVRARFKAAIPCFKETLYEEVIAHGYFVASPRETRRRYQRVGATLAGSATVIGLPLTVLLADFQLLIAPTVALIAIGLAFYRLARVMPVKTARGAEEAAKWRAFRRYLASLERQEDLATARGIFASYLPYATALGLEQEWVKKFTAVNAAVPSWFGGIDGAALDGVGDIVANLDFVGSAVSTLPLPSAGNAFDAASQAFSALPALSDLGQVFSDVGDDGLQIASDALSGLLECAASVFDW